MCVEDEPGFLDVSKKVTPPSKAKLSRRNYTDEDLQNALSAYRSGAFTSLRAAGKAFGVPSSTLSDKLLGS